MSLDPLSLYLMTGVFAFPDVPNEVPRRKNKFEPKLYNDIKAIQLYLLDLGYKEVGFIDGIEGPRLHAALEHYRRDCKAKGTDA